jgi:hypothetical protein
MKLQFKPRPTKLTRQKIAAFLAFGLLGLTDTLWAHKLGKQTAVQGI